jgi:hypothetical protein
MRSDLSQRPEHERRLLPRYRVWAPTVILPCDDATVPPVHTVSQVVYSSPAAAGSHTVGAKFVAELPASGEIRRAS